MTTNWRAKTMLYTTTITHFEEDGHYHKTKSDKFDDIETAIEWGKDYGADLVLQMEEQGFEVEEFRVDVRDESTTKVFSEMVKV